MTMILARLSATASSGKVAARNLFPSGSLSLRLDREWQSTTNRIRYVTRTSIPVESRPRRLSRPAPRLGSSSRCCRRG